MVEATEIAKLRLFLKMVAVVDVDRRADNLGLDPLPDIDFNIRCGNTLVGYATKEELMNDVAFGDMFARAEFEEKIDIEMQKVAMAYDLFKNIQLSQHDDIEEFKRAKDGLQTRLRELNDLLNQKMYHSVSAYSYEEWLSSHQPFHWLAEFYQIINGNRGFDVIIGNPPYVSMSVIKYQMASYTSKNCGDLYALCVERSCKHLLNNVGRIGMIVPISLVSTDGYASLRKVTSELLKGCYFANFGVRPSKLFDGVDKRLTIFISNRSINFTTKYYRWNSSERDALFNRISYQAVSDNTFNISGYPKISSSIERKIIESIDGKKPVSYFQKKNSIYIVRYTRKLQYFIQFFIDPPIIYNEKKEALSPTELKEIKLGTTEEQNIVICALNSSLFFWFFITFSDCRNVNSREIMNFPLGLEQVSNYMKKKFEILSSSLLNDFKSNSIFQKRIDKRAGTLDIQSFRPRLSKPVIDEIDKILAKHYGFTDEELDFIINYDIKYRMGSELDNYNEE